MIGNIWDLGFWGEFGEVETLVISAICSPPPFSSSSFQRVSFRVMYSGMDFPDKHTSFGTAT